MYDVIIIGSGWAGICTMKHCLEEGLTGIILEKNEGYGGVWNVENSPSVYANTYSVTSKYYLSMSDFPIPEHYPEFPHHTQVMEYMRMYVNNFKLEPYISFNSEVVQMKKSGIWKVKYINNGKTNILESRNIVICTGQNSKCKNYPDIDYSSFKGKVYHASEYNENVRSECLNKKVLIYGSSDTAFDIGVELTNHMYTKDKINNKTVFGYTGPNGTISNTKTTVYISMRKGRWIQRRTLGTYNPADMLYNRILDTVFKNTSKSIVSVLVTPILQIMWGTSGSGVPEWKTDAGYLNSYYVKSADILPKITSGDVIPLADISQIKSNSVISGKEYDVDIIIFATGYKGFSCFKFIPDNIKQGKFYDHIFLIDDPSVAKIGFIRPFLTSIPMIIEMQSRYLARVYSKKTPLPGFYQMHLEYNEMKEKQSTEFAYDYKRVEGIIDPYDYMNMIATKIKAYPSLLNLAFTDMILLYYILFHSWSHFIYRLDSNYDLAREQILNLDKNGTSNIIFVILHIFIITFLILSYIFFSTCGTYLTSPSGIRLSTIASPSGLQNF